MIFTPSYSEKPLMIRRPRPVWMAAGLAAATLAGSTMATIVVFLAEIPLRLASLAGADLFSPGVLGDPLVAGQVFATAGVVGAIIVGAPYYALTRSMPRNRRRRVVLEGAGIAMAFVLLVAVAVGCAAAIHVLGRDGMGDVSVWINAGGILLGSVLVIGAFGGILAAPAGVAAGAALAIVSFTYNQPREAARPNRRRQSKQREYKKANKIRYSGGGRATANPGYDGGGQSSAGWSIYDR